MILELSPQRDDVLVVAFEGDLLLRLTVATNISAGLRRFMLMNRFFAVLPVLIEARLRHSDVLGRCRLWLDDFPGGPGLCFSGNSVEHQLIPDSDFCATDGYEQTRRDIAKHWVPYEERADKVFWRGSSTGDRRLIKAQSWRDLPRFQLVDRVAAINRPDLFDVQLSNIVQIDDPQERAEVAAECSVGDVVPPMKFLEFKFGLDIDGNTCSWAGLLSRLMMQNAVLKVGSLAGFRQWYYSRLVPWHNFVPISTDMRDLLETTEWLVSSPSEAARIAENGRTLANTLTFDRARDAACETIAAAVGTGKYLPP